MGFSTRMPPLPAHSMGLKKGLPLFLLVWSSAESFQQLQPLLIRPVHNPLIVTTLLSTSDNDEEAPQLPQPPQGRLADMSVQGIIQQLQHVDPADLEREMEELSKMSDELDQFLAQHDTHLLMSDTPNTPTQTDVETQESISRLTKLRNDLNFIQGALDEMQHEKKPKDPTQQHEEAASQEELVDVAQDTVDNSSSETAATTSDIVMETSSETDLSVTNDEENEPTQMFAGMVIPTNDEQEEEESIQGKEDIVVPNMEIENVVVDPNDAMEKILDIDGLVEETIENTLPDEPVGTTAGTTMGALDMVKSVGFVEDTVDSVDETTDVPKEKSESHDLMDSEEDEAVDQELNTEPQSDVDEHDATTPIAEEDSTLLRSGVDQTGSGQLTNVPPKAEIFVTRKPTITRRNFQWREDALQEERMQNVFGHVPNSENVHATALQRGRQQQNKTPQSPYLASVNRHTTQQPNRQINKEPLQPDSAYAAALDRGRSQTRAPNGSGTRAVAHKALGHTKDRQAKVGTMMEQRNPRLNSNGEKPVPTNPHRVRVSEQGVEDIVPAARTNKRLVFNHIKSRWEVARSDASLGPLNDATGKDPLPPSGGS